MYPDSAIRLAHGSRLAPHAPADDAPRRPMEWDAP
jgi:hypothetical protein